MSTLPVDTRRTMSTKALPARQRSFGTSGENIYNMPSHHTSNHLPPLASQTVGGGGSSQGVKVQQLFEPDKGKTGQHHREIIQNGGIENSTGSGTKPPPHLPAVRPSSSAGSTGSKGLGSAKRGGPASSPESAMKQFMHKLSSFEHHEIFNYPQIYFVGPNAKKRQGVVGGANNNGYDDEQGSYIHVPHDHIGYRYEVLKVIGKGSFGQVCVKCHASNISNFDRCALFLTKEQCKQRKGQITVMSQYMYYQRKGSVIMEHMCVCID